MTKEELAALPEKVRIAIEAGKAAAEAHPNDAGSANCDRVVIPVPGLRAIQLPTLPGYVQKKSRFHQQGIHLDTPWPGIGNQHSAGVQAMHASLQAQGVDCYVWYQLD
ncbi:hypothetical protein D3C76_211160 [compost metagenome]|uniref:hypothetical protein n=1 Tax=Pseudomonas TaxID=286 RepID=UPI000FA77402|nr:hypothetical protein [Pseudomonas asiatica]WJM55916.1 hypothetical protein QUC26_12570 [Pseudomonas asiatica]